MEVQPRADGTSLGTQIASGIMPTDPSHNKP